jgi:hypothetical protein
VLAAAQFGPIIAAFRSCMTVGTFLSAACWSTGAYAPNPSADPWSGLNVQGLTTHGGQLNVVNIMAYDAGNVPADYNPETAFAAYRKIFTGALCLGIELGPMGWGPYITTAQDVTNVANCVKKDGNGGAFIWSWFQNSKGSPTVAQTIAIINSIFA